MISLEHELGLHRIESFQKFDKKIKIVSVKLNQLLTSLKVNGKSIAGYGAPTKATTLMGHFGLDAQVLDFIVDDNPLKQGLFTPITHIPILSTKALYESKPDYVLILAWNFAEPIMKMHQKFCEDGGQFILPMPEPEIVAEN